jgi:glycosyltransferase involved in cell wall biosynthesis
VSAPALSIVLPVFEEAESLPVLWQELEATLPLLGRSAEVIFVDDGSADGSTEVLRDLAKRDPRVRLVRLEDNAGLSAAFYVGYQAARAPVVVTMDSDLQNDPRDMLTLLQHLEGVDAVVGWRQVRHDSWVKRASSRIANRVRDRLTGDRVRDSASSFRVVRRECLAAIPPFDGMHRFVPTLLRSAGYRVVEVPVSHRPRRYGRSKFGIPNRLRRVIADVLAVRWMLRRRHRYRVAEEIGGDVSPDPPRSP